MRESGPGRRSVTARNEGNVLTESHRGEDGHGVRSRTPVRIVAEGKAYLQSTEAIPKIKVVGSGSRPVSPGVRRVQASAGALTPVGASPPNGISNRKGNVARESILTRPGYEDARAEIQASDQPGSNADNSNLRASISAPDSQILLAKAQNGHESSSSAQDEHLTRRSSESSSPASNLPFFVPPQDASYPTESPFSDLRSASRTSSQATTPRTPHSPSASLAGGLLRPKPPGNSQESSESLSGQETGGKVGTESGKKLVAYLMQLQESLLNGNDVAPPNSPPPSRRRSLVATPDSAKSTSSRHSRGTSNLGVSPSIAERFAVIHDDPMRASQVERMGSCRSRSVQVLMDAICSRDDSKLQEALFNLKHSGNGDFSYVLNELHPVTGCTPLHEAVKLGSASMAQILLIAGSDPNKGHEKQGPPLLHAAAFGNKELVELLIGAKADIAASDIAGDTALHFALRNAIHTESHKETAAYLISQGADVHARNAEGETPIELAGPDVAHSFASNPNVPITQYLNSSMYKQSQSMYSSPKESRAYKRGNSFASEGGHPGPPYNFGSPASTQRIRGADFDDIIKSFNQDDADIIRKSQSHFSGGSNSPVPHTPNGFTQNISVPRMPRIMFSNAINVSTSSRPSSASQGSTLDSVNTTPEQSGIQTPLDPPLLVADQSPVTSPRGSPPSSPRQAPADLEAQRVWMHGHRDPQKVKAAANALERTSTGASHEAVLLRAEQLFSKSLELKIGDIQWTRGELLGEGAFGKVYAGLNQQTGELMAVKVLEVKNRGGNTLVSSNLLELQRELELYKNLKHKHVVGYIDAQYDNKSSTLFIFLEFVPGGSISSMLDRFGCFSEDLVRNYTRQLVLGLEYLHACKIVHRDLKGGNVLVSRDGIVKLADFGASKKYKEATITEGMKSLRGSVFWMAPEVIKGTGYGHRADIWSLGCTVIEMMTGKHPWPDFQDQWVAMFQISQCQEGPPRPTGVSSLALDFLDKCLAFDKDQRPTAAELLHHEFIAGIGPARKEAGNPGMIRDPQRSI